MGELVPEHRVLSGRRSSLGLGPRQRLTHLIVYTWEGRVDTVACLGAGRATPAQGLDNKQFPLKALQAHKCSIQECIQEELK